MSYAAGIDPSGGGKDTFAVSVLHNEGPTKIVHDFQKGWAPSRSHGVNLAGICEEIAAILRAYGLYRAHGDKYGGRWVAQEFQKVGVYYEPAEVDTSRAFAALEPWLAQGRLELLDHPELLRELRLLEKRARVGNKPPLIAAPRGGHDDHAAALAHAVYALTKNMSPPVALLFDPPAETRRAPAAVTVGASVRTAAALTRRTAGAFSDGAPGRGRLGGFWRR